MDYSFHVEVLEFSNLEEIDGTWTADDFAALLDAMEYGDRSGLSNDELREMCLMSLQDQDPEEAAYLVLRHVIGDALREGQLRNMSTEMPDEKLWEEYVDPAFHERLFRVGSLLYAAMPGSFPKPDAVRVQLEVTASNAASGALLTATPAESFLVRLLADGMDSDAVLHRFYGEQLKADRFPDAERIVWIVEAKAAGNDVWAIDVIGSGYWLDALERTRTYTSGAYPDAGRAR